MHYIDFLCYYYNHNYANQYATMWWKERLDNDKLWHSPTLCSVRHWIDTNFVSRVVQRV